MCLFFLLSPQESGDQSSHIQLYSSVIAPNISQDALKEAEDLGIAVAKKLHEIGATEILTKAKEETANKAENKWNYWTMWCFREGHLDFIRVYPSSKTGSRGGS